MAPDIIPAGVPLELAERINDEHRACEEAVARVLEHALRCGELLEEAKVEVKAAKGSFGDWLRDNFGASHDTANLYMRLARNRHQLVDPENSERVRNLSLRQARQKVVEAEREAKKQPPVTAGDIVGPAPIGELEPPSLPETVLYRGDPPDHETLSEALGKGRAAALTYDVLAAGKKSQLAGVKGFLDSVAREARDAQRDAHLLVFCSPDLERLQKAEKALQRRAPQTRAPQDPVARVLPLLSRTLARQGSSSFFDHMPRSGGIVVARATRPADADAAADGGQVRLVLLRGGLRISVLVREETVADLTEMVVVDDVEDRYRRAAEAGAVRFGVQEKPGGEREAEARGPEAGRQRNLSLFLEGGVEGGIEGGAMGARRYELPAVTVADGGQDGLGVEDDPPRPADAEEEAVYEAFALRSAMERVMPYVSAEDTRPMIASVYFEPVGGGGGGTRLVATDSYRLICEDSLASHPFLAAPAAIPRGDARLLLEILKRSEPGSQVSIFRAGPHILVCGDLDGGADFELVCRPAAGYYPEYRKLLPSSLATFTRFGLPRREALAAVAAALELEESGPRVTPLRVEIDLEGSSATISLRSELGAFSATMAARGPENAVIRRIAINPVFLGHALRSLDEETAWLWINQDQAVDAAGATATPSLKPALVGVNADILLMPMGANWGDAGG